MVENALTEPATALQDGRENTAKRRPVLMTVQDTECVKIIHVFVKKITLVLIVQINVANGIVMTEVPAISITELVLAIQDLMANFVKIRIAQQTVQERVSAKSQLVHACVKKGLKALTALLNLALINAQITEYVSKGSAFVTPDFMERIARKRIAQLIAIITDTAKMEHVFVMKDTLERLANIDHVKENATLEEYANRMELVNVIKDIWEMIVQLLSV
jgi:hypothetical protein